MNDEDRVAMLADFLEWAMQEDCTGVALSERMEQAELWLAGYRFGNVDGEQTDAERWWVSR